MSSTCLRDERLFSAKVGVEASVGETRMAHEVVETSSPDPRSRNPARGRPSLIHALGSRPHTRILYTWVSVKAQTRADRPPALVMRTSPGEDVTRSRSVI